MEEMQNTSPKKIDRGWQARNIATGVGLAVGGALGYNAGSNIVSAGIGACAFGTVVNYIATSICLNRKTKTK